MTKPRDVVRVRGWGGTRGRRYLVARELPSPSYGPCWELIEVIDARDGRAFGGRRVIPQACCHTDRSATATFHAAEQAVDRRAG